MRAQLCALIALANLPANVRNGLNVGHYRDSEIA